MLFIYSLQIIKLELFRSYNSFSTVLHAVLGNCQDRLLSTPIRRLNRKYNVIKNNFFIRIIK